MKAYVTGGTGFIGSHLVEQLADGGDHVTVLIRKTSNLRWLNHLAPKIQFVTADLHDIESLIPTLEDVDVVFHLAGLTKAPDTATYNHVNAEGTRNLIEACLHVQPRLKRFIYCSSLAAIGPSPNQTPICENTSPYPLTDYGKSKLKGEMITRNYADRLPITIVRPPAVYGPRDTDIFIYFQFIRRGLMPIIGDENRLLSFVHVKDLVVGMHAAALSDRAVGEAYFLTDGVVHSWIEFAQTVACAMEKQPIRFGIPFFVLDVVATCAEVVSRITRQTPTLNRQKMLELKQPFWICDSTKAEEQFGYRPVYSLEKGIKETAGWYLENRWLK